VNDPLAWPLAEHSSCVISRPLEQLVKSYRDVCVELLRLTQSLHL
jgi:hypothetical protein